VVQFSISSIFLGQVTRYTHVRIIIHGHYKKRSCISTSQGIQISKSNLIEVELEFKAEDPTGQVQDWSSSRLKTNRSSSRLKNQQRIKTVL
jgi:hypothetical protein